MSVDQQWLIMVNHALPVSLRVLLAAAVTPHFTLLLIEKSLLRLTPSLHNTFICPLQAKNQGLAGTDLSILRPL